MKRNSVKSLALVSIALSTFLVGCGGNPASSDGTDVDNSKVTKSIEGKAVDGYLQYATVCLDLNKDGYCQAGEPTTQTLEDGSFKLDISADIQKDPNFDQAMLLVYGGKDVDSGDDFIGKLLAPADSDKIVVTPITTLVAKAVQEEIKDKKLSKDEIKKEIEAKKALVAKILDLKREDIDKDPVKLYKEKRDKKLLEKAIKLHKVAQALAEDNNDNSVEKVYDKLAKTLDKIKDISDDDPLDALLDESFNDDLLIKAKIEKAKKLSKKIEKALDKLEDMQKVSVLIDDDIERIKEGKDIEDIELSQLPKSEEEWEKKFLERDLDKKIDDEKFQAIKAKIGKIKPGTVIKMKEKLKNDDKLKDIYEKVAEKQEKEKIKREKVKSEIDGAKHAFKEGMKFYNYRLSFDPSKPNFQIAEITLGKGEISEKELGFDPEIGDFMKIDDDNSDDQYQEIVLKGGKWTQEEDKRSWKYTINSDGTLSISDENVKVKLLSEKDLSNQDIFVKELHTFVKMPDGAKRYLIGIEGKERYSLDKPLKSFYEKSVEDSDINGFINRMCQIGILVGMDGKECDATTKQGYIKLSTNNNDATTTAKQLTPDTIYGKWSVDNIGDEKIINLYYKNRDQHDGNEIISAYNGTIYKGWKDKKTEDIDINYNDIAIDAIKEKLKELGKVIIYAK